VWAWFENDIGGASGSIIFLRFYCYCGSRGRQPDVIEVIMIYRNNVIRAYILLALLFVYCLGSVSDVTFFQLEGSGFFPPTLSLLYTYMSNRCAGFRQNGSGARELVERRRKNIPCIRIYMEYRTYLQVYWRRVYTYAAKTKNTHWTAFPFPVRPDTPKGVSLERGQTISVADIREIWANKRALGIDVRTGTFCRRGRERELGGKEKWKDRDRQRERESI